MLLSLVKKFQHAFVGLYQAIISDKSVRLQVFIALFVILLGVYLNLKKLDFIIILFCVFIVIGFEIFNSCIEMIVDHFVQDYNLMAKRIKDFSSASVLVVSLMSLIIGILVFYEYVKEIIWIKF